MMEKEEKFLKALQESPSFRNQVMEIIDRNLTARQPVRFANKAFLYGENKKETIIYEYLCPLCGHTLFERMLGFEKPTNHGINYCPNCGQVLKWEKLIELEYIKDNENMINLDLKKLFDDVKVEIKYAKQ